MWLFINDTLIRSQVSALSVSQGLLKACGLRIAAYGAPYNAANNYTLAAIRTQTDIKLWFFPTPGMHLRSARFVQP